MWLDINGQIILRIEQAVRFALQQLERADTFYEHRLLRLLIEPHYHPLSVLTPSRHHQVTA